MSLFTKYKIYPNEDVSVKQHFSEFYDTVFIAFLPFIRMNTHSDTTSFSASKQISVAQAKAESKELETIKLKNVNIFSINEDYPEEKEIYENGTKITWQELISQTKLEDTIALNKALKTSIGAYKKQLERQDLLTILDDYTDLEKIWHPTEGGFDVFTKKSMYRMFKNFDLNIVVAVDEFFESSDTYNLDELTELEFIEKVYHKKYYIYAVNKEILFAIDWDSFFYFIATNESKLEYIKKNFEGFVADEKTTHLWDWKEGEINSILNANKPIDKKP